MVKTELKYNPYILETKITFNGQPPRINSLVEKYQDGSLQTWITKIPEIFYNEMNGYDFELHFSGTKLDYEELKESFLNAGVKEDQVKLFHKNELNGRIIKARNIESLLKWLNDNPNNRFAYQLFREENRELFDDDYPMIILNGSGVETNQFEDMDISIEFIENISEISGTKLTNIPIVIHISADNVHRFQSVIREMINRQDVINQQLFFIIHNDMDVEKVERVIQDLGIREPQIIDNIDDKRIHSYMEKYPVTDYVQKSLKLLRQETEMIGWVLDEEDKKNSVINQAISEKIDQLESAVANQKEALNNFLNRDNLELPDDWVLAQKELLEGIKNWKNRKTKTTKYEEAYNMATDLNQETRRLYDSFINKISQMFFETVNITASEYRDWFSITDKINPSTLTALVPQKPGYHVIPDFTDTLLKTCHEEYVAPKEDLFGKFFRNNNSSDVSKEKVLETTYNYSEWRALVSEIIMPISEECIDEFYEMYQQYASQSADIYIRDLRKMIADTTGKYEEVRSQLSDEEKKFRIDNDWYFEFCDCLKAIERD